MKIRLLVSLLVIVTLAAGAWAAQKHHSDDELYDLVRRKLADDVVVKGGALEVDVKEGVVTFGSAKVEAQESGTFSAGDFVPRIGQAPEIAQAAFALTTDKPVGALPANTPEASSSRSSSCGMLRSSAATR